MKKNYYFIVSFFMVIIFTLSSCDKENPLFFEDETEQGGKDEENGENKDQEPYEEMTFYVESGVKLNLKYFLHPIKINGVMTGRDYYFPANRDNLYFVLSMSIDKTTGKNSYKNFTAATLPEDCYFPSGCVDEVEISDYTAKVKFVDGKIIDRQSIVLKKK